MFSTMTCLNNNTKFLMGEYKSFPKREKLSENFAESIGIQITSVVIPSSAEWKKVTSVTSFKVLLVFAVLIHIYDDLRRRLFILPVLQRFL